MDTLESPWLNSDDWSGKLFSDGWQSAAATHDVIEPATGKTLTTIGMASLDQLAAATRAARDAQITWADVAYRDRAAIMRKAAVIMAAHAAEISHWLLREAGAVGPRADYEIGEAIEILHEAASIASQPQGLVLPGTSKRMSFARRVPLGAFRSASSALSHHLIFRSSSRSVRSRRRSRSATPSFSSRTRGRRSPAVTRSPRFLKKPGCRRESCTCSRAAPPSELRSAAIPTSQ